MDKTCSMEEAITWLVVACLNQLIKLGEVKPGQINNSGWHIAFRQKTLSDKGFAGAAALDTNNRPVIYLSSNLTEKGLLYVIAHETVHLMQICKGDLIPGYGSQIWKGKSYKTLPANHPDYFEHQPWEKDAERLQPVLLNYLESIQKS